MRVDASSLMGTGHFMRCLTLADALKVRGAQTRFVARGLPKHLEARLLDRGHELVSLASPQGDPAPDGLTHATWLGVSQVKDATDTIRSLSDAMWDWLVVDHYALDSRWESLLRQTAKSIFVIDDIADRQHDCDVLLDQNFYVDMESRYVNKVPERCRLLLGPSYALLRDEFRKLRKKVTVRNGPVKRILVFFGGVDADNHTGRAIEALSKLDITGLGVDVVIGAQHPSREQIRATCGQRGFTCHVQTDQMAELMAAADLAVGAGGSASWERCCLGLPCVVGAVAQNQIQAAKDLSAFGAVRYIGAGREITVERLKNEIELACSPDWLAKASALGFGLVDARGTAQILRVMEAK